MIVMPDFDEHLEYRRFLTVCTRADPVHNRFLKSVDGPVSIGFVSVKNHSTENEVLQVKEVSSEQIFL